MLIGIRSQLYCVIVDGTLIKKAKCVKEKKNLYTKLL